MGAARRFAFGLLVFLHVVGPSARALANITPVWTSSSAPDTAPHTVVIEAEEVHEILDGSNWLATSAGPDFCGHGYLDHADRDGIGDGQTALVYHFQLSQAGDYVAAVRARQLPSEEEAMANITLRLEPGFYEHLPLAQSEAWQIVGTSKPLKLGKGIHELRVLSRNAASFAIDRILNYPAEGTPPSNDVPASGVLYSPEYDDLAPPSAPRNLRVKGHGCAHLHLVWDPSEDAESAVLAYDIYWRRRWLARSFQPEYVLGNLDPYSLYHINVQAVDLGGNLSRETRFIVETSDFSESEGARVTQSPPRCFVLDGKRDPLWERHRPQALSALPSSTDDAPAPEASFRLAWDREQLSILVETPPLQSPQVRIDLDAELTQTAHRNERHQRYVFPLSEPNPNAEGDTHEPSRPACITSTTANGQHLFEIAIPRTMRPPSSASDRDHLLGMNLSIWEAAASPKPVPVAAWRWDEARSLPTESPYQFGVLELAHALRAGEPGLELPPNIWRARDGFVVIEAEAIQCDSSWRAKTAPEGYLGEGFLQWHRPPVHPIIVPQSNTTEDFTTAYQGSQERWIITRVYTERPGLHDVRVRFKRHASQAQRVWVGRLGQPVGHLHPVRSLGIESDEEDPILWSPNR